MSSSISSTTQQQQFTQVQQSAVKADAATKTDPAKAGAQPAALTAQAPTTPGGIKGVPESKSFRNNDGTYGPNHTATAPFNPLKPSGSKGVAAAAPETSEVGVNVKI